MFSWAVGVSFGRLGYFLVGWAIIVKIIIKIYSSLFKGKILSVLLGVGVNLMSLWIGLI